MLQASSHRLHPLQAAKSHDIHICLLILIHQNSQHDKLLFRIKICGNRKKNTNCNEKHIDGGGVLPTELGYKRLNIGKPKLIKGLLGRDTTFIPAKSLKVSMDLQINTLPISNLTPGIKTLILLASGHIQFSWCILHASSHRLQPLQARKSLFCHLVSPEYFIQDKPNRLFASLEFVEVSHHYLDELWLMSVEGLCVPFGYEEPE